MGGIVDFSTDMLRRGLLNTRRTQYLLPVRGKFPGLNEKEVFSFEPEFWEVAGAPPEPVESDPTTGWTQDSRRVGTLAQKVGMIHEFDDWMSFVPLTVLFIPGCQVAQVKTAESDGYTAMQVASGWVHPKNQSKPVLGHLKKHGVPQAKRKIQEFRVTPDALLPPGTDLSADHYTVGQKVDVCAYSKGKGWQGPMKRWGFSGGNATHGNSKAHRSHGSMGGCQDPGKVWKGKKMAGRMGGKRTTVKNLLVYRVDPENNLVYVKGAVPGPSKAWVRLTDAKNKKFDQPPPFPTAFRRPHEPADETVLFVPKPSNVTWDVEDIELRTNVYKDIERQKLIDDRATRDVNKTKRRREEKKARKDKKLEMRKTKAEQREELQKKRDERAAVAAQERAENPILQYEEDSDLLKE